MPTWDEATQSIKGDLSGTLPIFDAKLAVDREHGKAELVAFITNLTYTNNMEALDTQAFQESLETFGQDVVSVAGLAFRGMVATQGNDRQTGDDTDEIIAGWGGNDLQYHSKACPFGLEKQPYKNTVGREHDTTR